MTVSLYDHQVKAIEKLKTGSILQGGVGSGKTRTALAYFMKKHEFNKKLYVITTARKRDSKDWEEEAALFSIDHMSVDSWNNIHKYILVMDAFFIFDEQRLIGNGVWVKSFLRIVKNNQWILLTATPGDSWMDYVPVFIANGFYKNRTEFVARHVVYSRFSKFPKVERYLDVVKLEKLKKSIMVNMHFVQDIEIYERDVVCEYEKNKFDLVKIDRWNPYADLPVSNVSELCFLLRKIVNSDRSRLDAVLNIFNEHGRIIVFYNFNYELDLLIALCQTNEINYAQWNGHVHEFVPKFESWVYLVQYSAGCEGWNCIETNCVVFFSQNYSYRVMIQASGRVHRLNTKYKELFFYTLISEASIDVAIRDALRKKRIFNERSYMAI